MIDWRGLLSSIEIEWADRGPNTSKGNININCVFCAGADPSKHLAINETDGSYYCFRGSRDHSGRNPVRLLIELGIRRTDAYRLLTDFEMGGSKQIAAPTKEQIDAANAWDRFKSIKECPEALDYLESRGFDPDSSWSRFDLRFAEYGDWKYRILFPIRYDRQIFGWTGRHIYNRTPLYKMQDNNQPGHIYQPSFEQCSVVVIVEGPMDALKIASAGQAITAIALVGKDHGPSRLLRLQNALAGASLIWICLDRDAPFSEARSIYREISALVLRSGKNRPSVRTCAPPAGQKDCGGATYGELGPWLQERMILPILRH